MYPPDEVALLFLNTSIFLLSDKREIILDCFLNIEPNVRTASCLREVKRATSHQTLDGKMKHFHVYFACKRQSKIETETMRFGGRSANPGQS